MHGFEFAPRVELYVSMVQFKQSLIEVAFESVLNVPVGHFSQSALACLLAKLPAAQSVQNCEPGADAYVPVGQGKHPFIPLSDE